MVRYFLLCALAASAGCSFGDDRHTGNGDAGPQPDGMMKEKDHLLLTEIKGDGAEFIEIWNPTSRTIDLSNYYLSDVGDYWRYPSSSLVIPDANDFIVRFPDKAMLAPKAVITIGTNAVTYNTSYGVQPTYSIELASGAQAFRDRRVTSDPSITGTGEIVVLFYWDGTSDLVKDVDMVLTGENAAAGNRLKPRQPVDGPDANAAESVYEIEDGMLGGGMNDTASTATSYKRRALEANNEKQDTGGNGITGDDETSENLKVTWDGDAAMPLSAATPGTVPNF